MKYTRDIIALLISPAITAACATVLSEFFYSSSGVLELSDYVLIVSFPAAYIFAVIFGLPSISILEEKNKLTVLWVTITGLILGVIAFLSIDFVVSEINENHYGERGYFWGAFVNNHILLIPISGFSAAVGAFVYCKISGITNRSRKWTR